MAMLLFEVVYRFLRWILIDLPDPRLDDGFLCNSVWYPIIVTACYALWVQYMPDIMKRRQPFRLETIMTVYNVVQVVLCGYASLVFTQQVLTTGHSIICEPIDYTINENTKVLIAVGKLYYYLKILDMVDTVFNVLRKKTVSFLHSFHHGGMVTTGYIAVRYLCGGMNVWIGLINCYVHTVMYFYYLLCSYNKDFKKSLWWKKHLTQMQLLQFCIFLAMFGRLLVSNTCGYPLPIALVIVTMTSMLVLLFSDFYYKAYIVKSSKGRQDNGKGGLEKPLQAPNVCAKI